MELHKPVLLKEAIEYLNVKPGCKYIDCTFGFGGHAKEILKRGGIVLGIDSDLASLDQMRSVETLHEASLQGRLWLVNGNFSKLQEIAAKKGFKEADGILYDLGLSSWQLHHSKRGFSFQRDEPLDMRSDLALNVTAADLISTLSVGELTKLFKEFGEETRARYFARALVGARALGPIRTTFDLLAALGLYSSSDPDVTSGESRSKGRIHPATKVFQALRIAVNSELLSLTASLPQAQKLLKIGGRLVVLSFHSLEDRIVKEFGREAENLVVLNRKPVTASVGEIAVNPRARSAKLRAFEKVQMSKLKAQKKFKY